MGELQPIHWIVVLVIVLMVFGLGKLPNALADLGKGIHSLRGDLRSDGDKPPAARSDHPEQS